MAIRNRCSGCEQILSVPDSMRGRTVKCPSCGGSNRIVTSRDMKEMVQREIRAEERARTREIESRRLGVIERVRPEVATPFGLVGLGLPGERLRDGGDLILAGGYLVLLFGMAAMIMVLLAPDLSWALRLSLALMMGGSGVLGFTLTQLLSRIAHAVADLAEVLAMASGQAPPDTEVQALEVEAEGDEPESPPTPE